MTEDVSSLILEHLRAIRGDIADLKHRMDSIEIRMLSLEDHMRGLVSSVFDLQNRVGRMEVDLRQIKRRSDLADVE
ncbi:MAG: hypothetical protein E6Q98_06635 [Rhodospirillaceae bacterium]|nr:MAG: hypothetical protein E6Q98_06635 [Rhodospirillaceae bacterium]